MRYALVGGDERAVYLTQMLQKEGGGLRCFALEKSGIPPEICAESLTECVKGAECVILAVPSLKNGFLNTPLSEKRISSSELESVLSPEQLLCGGFGEPAEIKHERVCDLLKSESFALGNARLTSEAATALLILHGKSALYKSRILILGQGRVAGALIKTLSGYGAELTVGARRDAAQGDIPTLSLERAISELERFDCIINTVPAPILPNAALERINKNALLMELASAPFGFDRDHAEALGISTVYAPGLPGRYSPAAAAELMLRQLRDCLSGVPK